jgi:DNA-binding response OmpR family regulator
MEEGLRTQTADPKDKTILLVEEDKNQRIIFGKMLSEQGFQVEDAADAKETLQKVSSKKYDLIMLEFALQGMGGMEMLHEIRNTPCAESAIIVWTAKNVDDHTMMHVKSEPGVKDFITKPVQHSILTNLLHKTLGTRPKPKQNPDDTGGFGKTTSGFGKRGW